MMTNGASPEEATPIISNRLPALEQLPALELPQSALPVAPSRVARFSNPNAPPIIMAPRDPRPTTALSKGTHGTHRSSSFGNGGSLSVVGSHAAFGSRRDTAHRPWSPTRHDAASVHYPHTVYLSDDAPFFETTIPILTMDWSLVGLAYARKLWRRLRHRLLRYLCSYLQRTLLDSHSAALWQGTRTVTQQLRRSRQRQQGVWNGDMEVQGLPNFGQTCFLNAVLQCLAALEPFLEYLMHIVCLMDGEEVDMEADDDYGIDSDDEDTNETVDRRGRRPAMHDPMDPTPSALLATQLLIVLKAINGQTIHGPDEATLPSLSSPSSSFTARRTSPAFIDPRPVLETVSREHAQFRNSNMFHSQSNSTTLEQQDAQELLQAVLGMVVQAAKLDVTSSVVSYFAGTDDRGILEKGGQKEEPSVDEILTAAAGAKANGRWKADHAEEGTPRIPPAVAVEDARGDAFYDSTSCGSNGTPAAWTNGVVSKQPTHYMDESTSQSDSDEEYLSTTQDEKKQDEYQPCLPHVASEESLLSHNGPEIQVDFQRDPDISPLASDSMSSSTISRGRKLSAAMRMMYNSTTSLTPSPFCGWLGSSLQCCDCKHVRPIQNAPFFDIPVIPTAVSNYLSGSVRSPLHRGIEPVKYSPTSIGPPCRLEEMLQQFTEVERVDDVECRNCTRQREVENLEEEAYLLQEGIKAKLARAKRSVVGETVETGDDPARQFRIDLRTVQSKLDAFKLTSPDDDGELERICALENPLLEEDTPPLSIERRAAYKRMLLTRLPSILAIHVQRRFYDPATNRMSKTAQHVIFPEYLDVTPYCVCGGATNSHQASTHDSYRSMGSSSQSSIIYRLQALIEHHGGAFSGHYVSYRRDPVLGTWFHISDDNVRRVEWDQVRTRQAYMLFYEAM